MKKNFLFGLIGAGALILSGSVGFAAWTINAKNSETGTGSINVSADGTITDNRIKIDTDHSNFTDGSISFVAALNEHNFTDPWLSASNIASADNLTLTYVVTVTGGVGLNVSANASIVDKDNGEFSTLIDSDHIIGALPTNINVTLTDEKKNGTYTGTIEATFTWGSTFYLEKEKKNVNPYVYYNSQLYSKDLADSARTNIQKLKTIESYDGLTLSYTVSVN